MPNRPKEVLTVGVKFIKKEELIQKPENLRPHVVLLGAGASKAAFPNGDADERALPLMKDMVEVLQLTKLLEKANIKPKENFETIYSRLNDNNRLVIIEIIERYIYDYFCELTLPATATHYDRLLLSLREKDAIFTFNWDPFLFDVYQRNQSVVALPEIFFLHGNVRIGLCSTCFEWGRRGALCPTCHKMFG